MAQLLLGALLLTLSLLAVLPPAHSYLWILSIPVREWGWVFALLCLPLLWATTPLEWLGAFLALLAAALFLVPLAAGVRAARQLPDKLGGVFAAPLPTPGARSSPFVWRDLFLGVRTPRVPVQTVTYAVHDGVALQMDVTRPGKTPAPAVIVIHGGAWRGGDRKQLSALNRYLTAQGYATAAISYRLAPKYRFPDALADVTAAVAYVKAHAAELGVDPTRLVLLGRSAGAQLAVVAAYTLADPAIRGAVSYYGPFALEWGYDQQCKVLDVKTVLGDYLGGSPDEARETYRAASPYALIHPRTPPILMIQGEDDTMVAPAHCHHLIEHLDQAGRPYHLVMVPRATHGSDVAFGGPFGQISTWATERFLAAVMEA